MKGKEVLLKIVTPIKDSGGVDSKFIELISNATNQQNEVSEADRRSNHDIQIELQKKLYNDYGYLYERKAGEFHDGIQNGFVPKELVVDRSKFIGPSRGGRLLRVGVVRRLLLREIHFIRSFKM
jgi:hypothetical protein